MSWWYVDDAPTWPSHNDGLIIIRRSLVDHGHVRHICLKDGRMILPTHSRWFRVFGIKFEAIIGRWDGRCGKPLSSDEMPPWGPWPTSAKDVRSLLEKGK